MARPKKAEVGEAEVKTIRVVATKLGYHNKRIREGEEFSIPEHLFSKIWMKRVGVKDEEVEQADEFAE